MTDDSSLRYYLNVARRSAWLILLTALLVGVTAYGASYLQGERYRSTATILYTPSVVPSPVLQSNDPFRAIDTLVALAQTDVVLQAAKPDSGFASTGELRSNLTVSSGSNSDLITISVSAPTGEQAAAGAEAVSKAFLDWRTDKQNELIQARIEYLRQQLTALAGRTSPSDVAAASDIRTQLAEAQAQLGTASADLSLVEEAGVPGAPYAPHPTRNFVLGFFIGLFLGVALALARDRLDRRLRAVEEIEAIYHAPVLGVVPFVQKAARGNRTAALGDFARQTPTAEAFRTIRTNLSLFMPREETAQVIVVSSALPEEGKSAATANLAAAYAVAGKSVLALSADVHAPSLHQYFEELISHGEKALTSVGGRKAPSQAESRRSTAEKYGMIEVLAGEVDIEQAVRRVSLNGSGTPGATVALLANSRRFFDPATLYESEAMESFLETARHSYDVVVIDAPPLLVSGDASVLAKRADALLFVARLGRLTREAAQRAARAMEAVQIRPIGIIVTGRRPGDEEMYGYGYGYGKQA